MRAAVALRTNALALCSAALTLFTAQAVAQNYPAKPIRLVLPFAGGTDVVGRLIALKLSPALGQQVVPDPRLGAGGNIAHDEIGRAHV